MNAEQILKLIDAGYTKDDIAAMSAPAEPAAKPDEQTPEPAPKPEAPAPDPAEQPTPEIMQRLEKLEGILAKIAENNIASSQAPAPEERKNVVAEVLEHL